jgi:threonyl-tRNA synthetase
MQKIPYIIVCGRREAESKKIAVRRHRLGNLGSFTMQEFLKRITKDLAQGEAPSAYIN